MDGFGRNCTMDSEGLLGKTAIFYYRVLGISGCQGMEKGAETATRQAVGRMQRVVLRQIEQRFGAVPAKVRRKVEAIDSLEPLADLAERVFVVSSVGELGLG